MFYNNKNPWTQFLCLSLFKHFFACTGTLPSDTTKLRHRYRYIAILELTVFSRKKELGPNPRYRNSRTTKRRNTKYSLLQFLIIFHFKWRLSYCALTYTVYVVLMYLISFFPKKLKILAFSAYFFKFFIPHPHWSLNVSKYIKYYKCFKLCITRVSICIYKITSDFIIK